LLKRFIKKKKQIFLSHVWGQDEELRDNHERTLQLAEKLKKMDIQFG
jgi:hypothetical protein